MEDLNGSSQICLVQQRNGTVFRFRVIYFRKISHHWTNCLVWRCLYLETPVFSLSLFWLEVQFVVFLCDIITRNESFKRNSPFSYKATIEMLQMILFVANFNRNFAAIFTLTINNYELYSDWIIPNRYVNSSPLNWKQYRFVSEETRQKSRSGKEVGRLFPKRTFA